MPRPREDFDDLRPFEFREPHEVLDPDTLYTVYEVARLLQGVELDRELDVETENVLLDWAIPWMIYNQESFVFAEPGAETQPGYYGLSGDAIERARGEADDDAADDGTAGSDEAVGDSPDT